MELLQEVNECLSSLGMLSEPFFSDNLEAEERELLRNRAKLASMSTERRKERAKKQQLNAVNILKERKDDKEATQKIYSRQIRDSAGNKVGKKGGIGPKKPILNTFYDEMDYDEESEYIFKRDDERKIKSNYDDFQDEEVYMKDEYGYEMRLTEDEQIQMALELSKLEFSDEPRQIMKDIRLMQHFQPGMKVEIFLPGQEESRQRTTGIVIHVLSSNPMGCLVELEYGIIGHVSGLCDQDCNYIPTTYSLSHPEHNQDDSDEELFLWEEKEVKSNTPIQNTIQPGACPVGCGKLLQNLSTQEIDAHVTLCLNK